MIRKVDDYKVFRRSHELTLRVYRETKRFPKEETYGLVSQMRRAAYSIPMNLKECSGGTQPEFLRYVRIALCSKEELDYQLQLVQDLGYLERKSVNELRHELDEIGKMLFSLAGKLAHGDHDSA